VSGKTVALLIEFLVGITLKIQLRRLFSGHPVEGTP